MILCRRSCLLFSFLILLALGSAVAQSPLLEPQSPPSADSQQRSDSKESQDTPSSQPSLEMRQADVERQLAEAQKQLEELQANASAQPETLEKLGQNVQRKKQISLLLSQQKATADSIEKTDKDLQELRTKFDRLVSDGLSESPPYSFLSLDQKRDELNIALAKINESAVTTAGDQLAQAKKDLEQTETAVRLCGEKAQANKDPAQQKKLNEELTKLEHQHKVAKETLELRRLDFKEQELDLELTTLRAKYLQEYVMRLKRHAAFTQEDFDKCLVDIRRLEEDKRIQLETAQYALTRAQELWGNARIALEQPNGDVRELEETEAAWRIARDVTSIRAKTLNEQLQRLVNAREAWDRRFQLNNRGEEGASDDQWEESLKSWENETEAVLHQLSQAEKLQSMQTADLRRTLVAIEQKVEDSKKYSEKVQNWIAKQKSQYNQLRQVYDANLLSIQASQRLHEKLLAEIEAGQGSSGLSDSLQQVWDAVVHIWNYRIATYDQNHVTVKKIFFGILLIVLGVWFSRRISELLARRILTRLGLYNGAAAAIQSIVFYVLVVSCALIALKIVSVPLTVFTFLGGALAIGFGFGSQNIVNNFISGLILLAERPVRVGDLIQLQEMFGTVEKIGARSTRIRTGENLEIIVPNSKFLENDVINWTLTDEKVRASVRVGVAYGSPTREVVKLLKHAAEDHGLVMDTPEPFCWFSDFGDNALTFDLHFWITVRTLSERRTIESDVRHRIDSLFREGGIHIAFPQRDVHLDQIGPLEVKLLEDPRNEDPVSDPKNAA